jgi:glutamyl-tRNA synthetase/nondiscriminating glutamyl-tRNA synthetase
MPTNAESQSVPAENPFIAADVVAVLRQHSWHTGDFNEPQLAWCGRAAALLGPHSADRAALADLLSLVFHYDARESLAQVESHAALSRYAARDALRELASLLLDPAPLTTERFNIVIDSLKSRLDIRGRELFHTLRLALAGRVGEGELDRVVLLLDDAAAANFATSVKSARTRVIEFCSALD